ncbi:MAG: hypothetical protein IE933_08325 [Sphingomonadales bacterium]|nr:hypothetical protein [Sphingomonadales bacterium]MBD3773971.1 hypothetical protein [Paracoccaceae bacterium]
MPVADAMVEPPAAQSVAAVPVMTGGDAAEPKQVIDLTTAVPRRPRCPVARAGEIVVCAPEDQEQFRLRPLDPRFDKPEPEDNRLRTTIGGVPVEADSEQADVGGWPSNRIMVRAKIKF